jgi:alpha-N-arabinofuranosidase
MRDAMVTALTLNIFNNHCDKVRMANAAQMVNNLHALFLASGEHCITTPTYHVFDMYKEHQGAEAITVTVTENDELKSSVTVSASVKDGKTLLTLGNLSCREDAVLELLSVGGTLPETAEGVLLQADDMHAHNTFEQPENVKPVTVTVDLTKPLTIPKAAILAIRF